ncbi:MAG TPA: hypothetical protein VEL76_07315 [Gemmataceae bacterium]|nr:hypothetical protein [Gemmataceae bacterium]
MATGSLEDRLAAIEAEVKLLRQIIEQQPDRVGWQAMVGAFLNDPDFEQAMKHGRRYRDSTRPKKKPKRTKPHGNS